jgi:hypothetical protein
MDTCDLFELVERKAHYKHGGCLMAIKSETGWKVVFGSCLDKHDPGIIDAIEDDLSLKDALRLAIIQDPVIEEAK